MLMTFSKVAAGSEQLIDIRHERKGSGDLIVGDICCAGDIRRMRCCLQ